MANLYLENVRLLFSNFGGYDGDPNQRSITIVLEDEGLAHQLADDGWNVKFDKLNRNGEPYPIHLPVAITYPKGYPSLHPRIRMDQGDNREYLEEDTLDILDSVEILGIPKLEIRPREWEEGRIKAFVSKMIIDVAPDMFSD